MTAPADAAALWKFERGVYDRGHDRIAGVDEAGRGPLAGPVVSAAVILDRDAPIEIYAIGTELLNGQIQDTNSFWMARQIAALGGYVR
ncbi:MAG: hypothetical protein ACK2U9_17935, partial [Anaerolineae bacterium]